LQQAFHLILLGVVAMQRWKASVINKPARLPSRTNT
jgi:hypothetical protein